MGTGFTIDTPLNVAKYGVSSVISLVDDLLIENLRKYYCGKYKKPYDAITNHDKDPRANRITEYLNLVNDVIKKQVIELKKQTFAKGTEICKYFEFLPETSSIKKLYLDMVENKNEHKKKEQQEILKNHIQAGSVNVNIMTKLDGDGYKNNQKLPPEFSDALSALRGYAKSNLSSSIVFSAGLNKKLYSYIENFDNFYPQSNGEIKKKIVIKVSDYRSALTQGKVLARKGLWVSEFRIESGLNCGGHAFATKGYLLGPVLDEFKRNRDELVSTLHSAFNKGLQQKGKTVLENPPKTKITVQGGISSSNENDFLLDYYNVDETGWGTPFLLVPEATSVDKETLDKLAESTQTEDIYMSDVSPLNTLFSNLRSSTSENAKQKRIEENNPGSTCPKGYLAFNTEFTERPICTASKKYQRKKIEELRNSSLSPTKLDREIDKVMDKSCICHELGGGVLIKHSYEKPETMNSAICPGPNISYFTRQYSFREMVDHIYGRDDLLKNCDYPNMFITEIKLYIDVLKNKMSDYMQSLNEKDVHHIRTFCENLHRGINYYKNVMGNIIHKNEQSKDDMAHDLVHLKEKLEHIVKEFNVTVPTFKFPLTPATV